MQTLIQRSFHYEVALLPALQCESAVFLSEPQLQSSLVSNAQASKHLRQRSPVTSIMGLQSCLELKPLSHTQNALLACASRGDVTLQHEKAAEGE